MNSAALIVLASVISTALRTGCGEAQDTASRPEQQTPRVPDSMELRMEGDTLGDPFKEPMAADTLLLPLDDHLPFKESISDCAVTTTPLAQPGA